MDHEDFEDWWAFNGDGRVETPLMAQCFEAGYACAMFHVRRVISVTFWVTVLGCGLFLLTGCEDTFRYPCQNPSNWGKPECQRPTCSATQTCPDQLAIPDEKESEVR